MAELPLDRPLLDVDPLKFSVELDGNHLAEGASVHQLDLCRIHSRPDSIMNWTRDE
jgi:hypothetical protein